jgi:hypothetical protein
VAARRARPAAAASLGDLAAAVAETLAAVPAQPEDAGVRALAARYARTIDEAAALADSLAQLPYDPDTAQQVARLRQRVEAHIVMVELGPKLLAALEALNASPRARAATGKPLAPAGPSALHRLRQGAA